MCFCIQVDRAQLRLKGIQNMLSLVSKDYLIPSTKYNILCGWLGLLIVGTKNCTMMPHCLSNVSLIPPCDRILLELLFSDLYKWAIQELRSGIIESDMMFKERGINPAVSIQDSQKVDIIHWFVNASYYRINDYFRSDFIIFEVKVGNIYEDKI